MVSLKPNPQSKSDFDIVKMCLEGDSVAWEILVKRYQRLVYHFPSKAGLAEDLADEIFQETFFALYQQLEKVTRTDNLAYWIGKVAQRLTWKAIREKRAGDLSSLDDSYEVESPEMIPEENLLVKLQQHQVRRALANLDGRCRSLLKALFYEEESDYQKVAKDRGLSIGSIGPTRKRCLGKLKKLLRSLGFEETKKKSIKKSSSDTNRVEG